MRVPGEQEQEWPPAPDIDIYSKLKAAAPTTPQTIPEWVEESLQAKKEREARMKAMIEASKEAHAERLERLQQAEADSKRAKERFEDRVEIFGITLETTQQIVEARSSLYGDMFTGEERARHAVDGKAVRTLLRTQA